MQSVIEENAVDVLVHQLKNYWLRLNIDSIGKAANVAFENYYADEDRYKFNYLHTLTWMIFLYRVSYILGKNGHIREADAVYYLNKIMHGVDWYLEKLEPNRVMIVGELILDNREKNDD